MLSILTRRILSRRRRNMVNVDEKNVDRCDGGCEEEVNGSAGVWADEQAGATLEWRLAGRERH